SGWVGALHQSRHACPWASGRLCAAALHPLRRRHCRGDQGGASQAPPHGRRRPFSCEGLTLRQAGELPTATLAELVAGARRQQIIDGRLQDGDRLPKQDELAERFDISGPSVREGLRILEAEGLITVRRGKFGGAFVHAPHPANAAYNLALVLE